MADDRPQSVAPPAASTNASGEHEETNWGEDWESAFQAEDDAFFSDGKEEEFFLEEKEPAAGGAARQDLDSSLEKTLSGIPDQGTVAGAKPATVRINAEAIRALFLVGKAAALKQFIRLQSFPLFVRIPLYALPFLLVGAIFLASTLLTPSPPPRQAKTSPEQRPGGADLFSGGAGSQDASRLHPGKVRKKWGFPAFIIPVDNPAPDQVVTFVLVDITLIATLDEQEELPDEKKIFVRDIIYQFFQNKPLEELRRFSLARGEMNKELRAWLQKQWPEAPIESIIFNQYHLS
jgi:flagellar basal body-associated protein FliL